MWTDRRWLMLGVGASGLLNVFLIGVVAGHAFGGHEGGAPGGKLNTSVLVPPNHVRALPKDERKLFTTAMSAHRDAIRVARQDQQLRRQTTEADMAAATFDRDKVAADFKALREGASTVQQATQDGLLDALPQLSQASRAALVGHDPPASANAQAGRP